jgi:hypothetical protein
MNRMWRSDVTRAMHHFADATPATPSFDAVFGDHAPAEVRVRSSTEPERRGRRPALLAAATVAVVVGVVGLLAIRRSDPGPDPAPVVTEPPAPTDPPEPEPEPEPTTTTITTAPTSLPRLAMPGARANDSTGRFGWTGSARPPSTGWMHSVTSDATGMWRQTQIVFSVRDECFDEVTEVQPVPVDIAGLAGSYLEPYDGVGGPWLTLDPAGESTTGAYAIPIADRTLCVYLRWDEATTPLELQSARDVVDSIQGEPFGDDGIRIVYTLPPGWDTG